MKITQLTESKKLPGQFGAQIMSPEEFVARDESGEDVDPNLEEDKTSRDANRLWQMISDYERRAKLTSNDIRKQHFLRMADELRSKLPTNELEEGWMKNALAAGALAGAALTGSGHAQAADLSNFNTQYLQQVVSGQNTRPLVSIDDARKELELRQQGLSAQKPALSKPSSSGFSREYLEKAADPNRFGRFLISVEKAQEMLQQMDQRLQEATKLPAQQRDFGGQEFQDYMTRIKGTDDIDKKTGQVKVDKKGIPKYTTGKTKTDKYKMPYMHRSSVITYYDAKNKKFREEDVINALKVRPSKLLKQNEKMKHSNGELEQFFNVGFAALTGVAVDESTNKLIIVNTCPGAGSCKVDCFAMKGGKVQFKNAWLSDGKILTYLLNDPDGFFNQLSAEIAKEEKLGDKGGYEVTIRWHDAGDFFSPEYLDMAMKMASKHPGVKFYAYTKMADAALAKKPGNFIINWSEGAHTSQEKQVKAADPNLDTTKNSRIVPDEMFQDLLVKDQKGNLVKGPDGQWQVQPDKLSELKQRLAQAYKISPSSILSYDEYTSKPKVAGMKYNVIVAPGEGDISANDPNVLSTLLLRH